MTEQINWGNLIEQAGKELEPVPKGTYDVVVEDASDTQTSTQKLMYKLKFRIQGGAMANRVLWNNITLTTDNPTALAMFFRNMDSLGLDRQYFSMNPSPSDVAAALVGRTARVVIDHRLYQGTMRENVKQMMKAGGVGAMAGIPGVGAPAGVPVPGAMQIPSVGAPAPAPIPQPSAPVSAPVAPQPVQTPAPVVPTPAAPVQPSPEPTPPPVPEVATPVTMVKETPAAPPVPPPAPEVEPEPEAVDLDAYRAAGWSDAQLIAAGHMEAPAAPAPPAPPAPEATTEAPVQPAVPAGPPAPPPVPF